MEINLKSVLAECGFGFKKKFGQNFITDKNLLSSIVSLAGVESCDTVLEIGCGAGTLTRALADKAEKVVAFEVDTDLKPVLERTLAGVGNVEIVFRDFLKADLKELERATGAYKVVANLPYYITTPIVMGLFEGGAPAESITVMVQKEVADRMQASPGGKDYGAISLAVQYYAQPEIIANVPPNCFMPRPAVTSSVIHLKRHKTPPVSVLDDKLMFSIIRASFNQRRKTLANGIANASNLPFSKEQAQDAIRTLGLSVNVRGESLSLEQFAELSDSLWNLGIWGGGAG